MPKISIEDLKKIKERERGKMVLREGEYRAKITVHMGTCGIAAGARDVMTEFRDAIAQPRNDGRHPHQFRLRRSLREGAHDNGGACGPVAGESTSRWTAKRQSASLRST